MATPITPELLKPYFKEGKTHLAYKETVDRMKAIRVHSDGDYPHDLIDERRPSESPEILAYRKKIFEAITKETVSRIITCLSKIRRSSDWSIRYDENTFSKSVIPDEQPDVYFEEKFPVFGSLTKWTFDVGLKNYLVDANGLICVIPLETDIPTNEYLRPYPITYYSDQVIEFVQDDFAIIKSYDHATWIDSRGVTRHEGDLFFVYTTTGIERWEQVNEKAEVGMTFSWDHGLGYLPAFKIGGVYCKSIDKIMVWDSRIQPIVPRLNKAIREDNDLDVSVVRHLFPEKWEFTTMDCPKCDGRGKILYNNEPTECTACKGIGKVVSSPFQTHLLLPTEIGMNQVPVPPAGYIDKDVMIIELQEKRIEGHIFKALSALNLEQLAKVPLAESGVAKRYDAEESSNFVHYVAEDIVSIMDKFYKIGYDYRYRVRVPNAEDRKLMLPIVNVPENFNMMPVAYLIDEFSVAKTAKMNPILLNKMEEEIATKKFISDPNVANELICILRLDPFAGQSADDKLANGEFSTVPDKIISANILAFVRRAKFEHDDFYTWKLDKQQELMAEYAAEKELEIGAKGKLKLLEMKSISEGGTGDIETDEEGKVKPDQPNIGNADSKEQNDASSGNGIKEADGLIGKIPLALQQLALAAERAETAGDKALAKLIRTKMKLLLSTIETGGEG